MDTPCKSCNEKRSNVICIECKQVYCSTQLSHTNKHKIQKNHKVYFGFDKFDIQCLECKISINSEEV